MNEESVQMNNGAEMGFHDGDQRQRRDRVQAVLEGSRCSACTGRLMELVWSGPHGLDLDRIESAARVLCLSPCPATLVDRASRDKRKRTSDTSVPALCGALGVQVRLLAAPFRLWSAARVSVAQLLS